MTVKKARVPNLGREMWQNHSHGIATGAFGWEEVRIEDEQHSKAPCEKTLSMMRTSWR